MLRLGADRTLLRIAFVFMRRRIPRQTGNGAVLTRSPAGDGGVLFLTLALSALSHVSGAVADSRGHYPMTELLIGTVSWLATFGLIAAIIAEVFR